MLLIHSLNQDGQGVSKCVDELVNAHEHVTSTDPIPIAWFIILLHLGKALKSEIIEESPP